MGEPPAEKRGCQAMQGCADAPVPLYIDVAMQRLYTVGPTPKVVALTILLAVAGLGFFYVAIVFEARRAR